MKFQKKQKKVNLIKKEVMKYRPLLMGQCAGMIKDIKSADEIITDFINVAVDVLKKKSNLISKL